MTDLLTIHTSDPRLFARLLAAADEGVEADIELRYTDDGVVVVELEPEQLALPPGPPVEPAAEPDDPPESTFRCGQCGCDFKTAHGLEVHRGRKHRPEASTTPSRPAVPRPAPKPARTSAPPVESGDFKCSCGRGFSRQNGLSRHCREANHKPATSIEFPGAGEPIERRPFDPDVARGRAAEGA